MIPKIIHYCWLSKDPYPREIQACIDSWKKHLPDYELMLWNFDRFDKDSSTWVKQAYESKKYAFAADYLRLYAIYNYGGIYLDSDVEVLKSFDNLLELPYFLGKENSEFGIEAATIGAEKGCIWIERVLEYYKGRNFIKENSNEYDTEPLPSIIKKILTEEYSIVYVSDKKEVLRDKQKVFILSVDYFSPKKWDDSKILALSENTYSIHHFSGTWLPWYSHCERYIWDSIGVRNYNIVDRLYKRLKKSLKNKLIKLI